MKIALRVAASDFDADEAIQWLGSAAKSAAASVLFNMPWPKQEGGGESVDPGDALHLTETTGSDAPVWLAEESLLSLLDARDRLERIWAVATERELEVLDLLEDGHALVEIGEILGIPAGTVRKRLHGLRKRLT